MESREIVRVARLMAVADLRDLLGKYHLKEVDMACIDEGCSPILQENPNDGNLTFTLDRIVVGEDTITFEGSSSSENAEWTDADLDIEVIAWICDFLKEREDELSEYAIDLHLGDEKEEIYDQMTLVMHQYKKPGDWGISEKEASDNLYNTLVRIKNHWEDITGSREPVKSDKEDALTSYDLYGTYNIDDYTITIGSDFMRIKDNAAETEDDTTDYHDREAWKEINRIIDLASENHIADPPVAVELYIKKEILKQ